jgi:hypothetical protein
MTNNQERKISRRTIIFAISSFMLLGSLSGCAPITKFLDGILTRVDEIVPDPNEPVVPVMEMEMEMEMEMVTEMVTVTVTAMGVPWCNPMQVAARMQEG